MRHWKLLNRGINSALIVSGGIVSRSTDYPRFRIDASASFFLERTNRSGRKWSNRNGAPVLLCLKKVEIFPEQQYVQHGHGWPLMWITKLWFSPLLRHFFLSANPLNVYLWIYLKSAAWEKKITKHWGTFYRTNILHWHCYHVALSLTTLLEIWQSYLLNA